MSVTLQDSETLKNLMYAFAGESQARSRYDFAASLCHKEKLHVIEAIFTFTSRQEREHAEIFYNYMKDAAGQKIFIDGDFPIDISNDPAQLLHMAEASEYTEAEEIYSSFADTARKEGFKQIAFSFEQIAHIERVHGNRFKMFAELFEQGKLFVSDVQCGWMCLNCGHIYNGTNAPEKCPVCAHDQGYFIRLDMTFNTGISSK